MGEVEYADDEVKRVVIPYKPREPQLQIHQAMENNRFVVVVAHRRMGKTVAALNALIKAAMQNDKPNPRYAIISPTYSQSKRVAWDYLLEFVRPLEATANKSPTMYCGAKPTRIQSATKTSTGTRI